jgi:hypothetical protein
VVAHGNIPKALSTLIYLILSKFEMVQWNQNF